MTGFALMVLFPFFGWTHYHTFDTWQECRAAVIYNAKRFRTGCIHTSKLQKFMEAQ